MRLRVAPPFVARGGAHRDALYNSWDKNDPKDTQVLLHLLKTGVSQRYHDPLVHGTNDLQELAQTHEQISLRKVQVQHSIMTHYLPLSFPEADRYDTNSRAQWFTQMLHRFPCPAAITRYSPDAFEQEAWTVVGRKVNKRGFLADLYATASHSTGLAVAEDAEAIQMFRVMLTEHQHLCAIRVAIERPAEQTLQSHPEYQRCGPCREWVRFSRSRCWQKPGTCAGFCITGTSSHSVGLISAHSSPDSSGGSAGS